MESLHPLPALRFPEVRAGVIVYRQDPSNTDGDAAEHASGQNNILYVLFPGLKPRTSPPLQQRDEYISPPQTPSPEGFYLMQLLFVGGLHDGSLETHDERYNGCIETLTIQPSDS